MSVEINGLRVLVFCRLKWNGIYGVIDVICVRCGSRVGEKD
jgi:hypothetical protein